MENYCSLTFPYPIGDGESSEVAAIAGGVAGGVVIIVAIAAVVSGLLWYCHLRGQKNVHTSQQADEPVYEEIPDVELETQGAIEMQENMAYGPADSPEMQENMAYGPADSSEMQENMAYGPADSSEGH